MKDATPVTPRANERNVIFKCKQQTAHEPREPEKYNFTIKLMKGKPSGSITGLLIFRIQAILP